MQISNTEQIGEIPGLRLIEYKSFSDTRGSFAEVWNEADFEALNLPFLNPKQANVAVSEKKGVTRGLHAEPWDKLIWVTKGKVFCVWLDLREGNSYGRTETKVIEPGTAVWIPRGVANGYQTIEDETVYNYLTNGIWKPETNYISVNLRSLEGVEWPVPLDRGTVSEKDLASPMQMPVFELKKIVFGSDGRIGEALSKRFPNASQITGKEIRHSTRDQLLARVPPGSTLINCVGMTRVDDAETPEGFREALESNNAWVSIIADIANQTNSSLVHFSSDYVFDGTNPEPYTEMDSLNPISRYGISKALGDYAAMIARQHFILRFGWLITGHDRDFLGIIRTRLLSKEGCHVVRDQFGIPTFVDDIAEAVKFVTENPIRPGIYNINGSGDKTSWYEIALEIAAGMKMSKSLIRPVTTEYFSSSRDIFASRPATSVLDTSKLRSLGFHTRGEWQGKLRELLEHP